MALVRVSNNKYIDPVEIISVRKADNNKGWLALLTSGNDVFLTDGEWASVSAYVPIGVKSREEMATYADNSNINDALANYTNVFLETSNAGGVTITINTSVIEEGKSYAIYPWRDINLVVKNTNSSNQNIREKNGMHSSVTPNSSVTISNITSPIFVSRKSSNIYISF